MSSAVTCAPREPAPVTGSAGSLVGVAVRLRLALLRGGLRSGPGATARRAGLIAGAVGGSALALIGFTLLALSRGSGRLPEDLAVVVFAVLAAGWIVLPVLTFSSDDLLDPSRLALLPLTRSQLVTVLGTGALVGVAPVATLVVALGLLPATGRGASSYAVATAAAVLQLLLCVSLSRASAAALSGLLRSRRGRDLGVLLAALLGVSVQLVNPLVQLLARNGGAGSDTLRGMAGPLSWTPAGMLATAPGRSLPAAVAQLLVVSAVIALVLWWWERSVRRSLERPDSSRSRRRRTTGLAPTALRCLLPRGRAGAVAAKDLRYLVREPRRLVQGLTAVLVPALAVVAGPVVLAGGRPPSGLVFAVCGVALLTGLGPANRFGMDGSATWILLATAVDRRDARRDLAGGDLAGAIVAVPVILAVGAALALLTGSARHLPAAVGLALALFGTTVALSGLVAVSAAYPVPESSNAFSTGNVGQGCVSGLVAFGGLLAGALLCLPLLGLLLPSLSSPGFGLVLLVAGPAYGLLVGGLLREGAARRWTARSPDVLQLLATAKA